MMSLVLLLQYNMFILPGPRGSSKYMYHELNFATYFSVLRHTSQYKDIFSRVRVFLSVYLSKVVRCQSDMSAWTLRERT